MQSLARIMGCETHFATVDTLAIVSEWNSQFGPFLNSKEERAVPSTTTPHVGRVGSSRRVPANPQGLDVDLMSGLALHRRSYNEPGHAHELTFTCYNRFRFLSSDRTCGWLAEAIEKARAELDFALWAFV